MKNQVPYFQSILLAVLAAMLIAVLSLVVSAQPAAQINERFTFSEIELALLEQSNLLDQRLEKDGLVYQVEALTAYVTRIGQALLADEALPARVVWRFRVLRDPLANAFALPNGSIYVNTGLLALLENEAQLASVLAHEITHVRNRHGYLEQRSYRKKMVAIHIFQAAGAWVPVGSVVGATIYAISSVTPLILATTINGYRRELEEEADIFAVNKLSASVYDSRQMAETFRLLQKSYEVELVKVYYNDHPKLQERIAYVNNLVKRQTRQTVASDMTAASQEEYLRQTETAMRHNLNLDLTSGRFRTAVASSQKLVALNPKAPENLLGLAEAYRSLGPRQAELSSAEMANKEQKEERKLKQKFTLQEQDDALLATAAGQAAWRVNQEKAEALYRQVLALDPTQAEAHRGLGLLYEKAQKPAMALSEYRRYLEMRPEATDRLRIQRRIEALERPALKINR